MGFQLTLNFSEPSARATGESRLLLPTATKVQVTVSLGGKAVEAQTVATNGQPKVTLSFQLPPLQKYDLTAEARNASGALVFAGATTLQLVSNLSGTLSLYPVDATGSLTGWPVVNASVGQQAAGAGVLQGLSLAKGATQTFLLDGAGATDFTFQTQTGLEIYVQNTTSGAMVTLPATKKLSLASVGNKAWVTYYAPSSPATLSSLGWFAIPLQSVTSDGSLTLAVGGSKQLGITVTPLNADHQALSDFSWVSSNPAVATVDSSGNVTAVTAGSTSVTLTSNHVSTVTNTVLVTVTPPAVVTKPVTGVSLSPPSGPLNPGDTTTLVAAVLPADATNPLLAWSSGTASVATVNASTGLITALTPGTSIITVTTADGGFTATATVVVTGTSNGSFAPLGYNSLTFASAATLTEGDSLLLTTSDSSLESGGTGWMTYVDNALIPSSWSGGVLTVATTTLPAGTHFLDLLVTWNGITYNGSLTFTMLSKGAP